MTEDCLGAIPHTARESHEIRGREAARDMPLELPAARASQISARIAK